MKIAILGSGLLGVTTAYELARRGAEVVVLDRQSTSGAETSYANGGQLSYSHAEPWANAAVLPKLPGWMLRSDAPLVLRPRADWQMMRWGLGFLRNCTPARADSNCVNMLRLGLYSRQKMAQLRAATNIAFDFSATGVLHIFSTQHEFEHARRQNDFQAKFGCNQKVLTREQCLEMEPTLAYTDRILIGGMHADMDECGDAYMFCNNLAAHIAEKYGVQFRYGVSIDRLVTEQNRMAAVKTSQGDVTADAFVMAMGSYAPLYLRQIGIDLPIYPMKGYSLTLNANEHCPNMSITDGTYKIVYSRLGDRLRIAGTAEFAGYNTKINEGRITPIMAAAKKLFPKADWQQEIKKWACLRPSTPTGAPILGRTRYPNLFLNSGRGTLGWTQAAGSAAIVADIMEGKTPEIMTLGLTLGDKK
jgi:D-amino-acid dehydrogenase